MLRPEDENRLRLRIQEGKANLVFIQVKTLDQQRKILEWIGPFLRNSLLQRRSTPLHSLTIRLFHPRDQQLYSSMSDYLNQNISPEGDERHVAVISGEPYIQFGFSLNNKDVPFFKMVNEFRDQIFRSWSIFYVTDKIGLDRIAQNSPDFWSWRDAVFEMPDDAAPSITARAKTRTGGTGLISSLPLLNNSSESDQRIYSMLWRSEMKKIFIALAERRDSILHVFGSKYSGIRGALESVLDRAKRHNVNIQRVSTIDAPLNEVFVPIVRYDYDGLFIDLSNRSRTPENNLEHLIESAKREGKRLIIYSNVSDGLLKLNLENQDKIRFELPRPGQDWVGVRGVLFDILTQTGLIAGSNIEGIAASSLVEGAGGLIEVMLSIAREAVLSAVYDDREVVTVHDVREAQRAWMQRQRLQASPGQRQRWAALSEHPLPSEEVLDLIDEGWALPTGREDGLYQIHPLLMGPL